MARERRDGGRTTHRSGRGSPATPCLLRWDKRYSWMTGATDSRTNTARSGRRASRGGQAVGGLGQDRPLAIQEYEVVVRCIVRQALGHVQVVPERVAVRQGGQGQDLEQQGQVPDHAGALGDVGTATKGGKLAVRASRQDKRGTPRLLTRSTRSAPRGWRRPGAGSAAGTRPPPPAPGSSPGR